MMAVATLRVWGSLLVLARLYIHRKIMQEDKRCCGSGTCIINEEGVCWCGQRWDGEKMCFDVQAPTPDEPNDDE
jgi:hypothetical protein